MRWMLCGAYLALSGCANFTPPASVHRLEPNANFWVSYDSSRRGAWISTGSNGEIKSCAEPAPDIALSLSTGLKGSFESGGTNASGVDASATATALALAGRDNVVLLAREALFRICEQVALGNIDRSQLVNLYKEVFYQTTEIAKAQADSEKQKARQLELLDK